MTADPARPTVFIAEDNAILLQGLHRALTANGYDVRTAPDGAAMLRLLERERETPPDLLLLDVMMPALGGVELLGRLRADPAWQRLPVVLLTAATEASVAAAAAADSRAELMIKPFRLSELLETVASYMGGAAAPREDP